MVTLIIGIPDSGKSKMAEDMAIELAGDKKKYYIATMIPFGEEGQKRIQKHRAMREGKGFETIECPAKLKQCICEIDEISGSTCLVECMSNLVGNEMHGDTAYSETELVEHIIGDVKWLCETADNVVIVSNSFPADAEGYDEDTRNYVRAMDLVNDRLKELSDENYEYVDDKWIRSK